MTQFTTLKNDELQEINGGKGKGKEKIIDYIVGKVIDKTTDYAKNTLMNPDHYKGKSDYRTWYK